MRLLSLLFLLSPLAACKNPIPTALADIEGTAEHAYDKALVGDDAAVSTDAAALDSDWSGFRDQAEKDGAASADLSAMDDAIAGLGEALSGRPDLSEVELARAANAVSGPMDELFALYDDAVPPTVLALDYGGREVSLDAMDEVTEDGMLAASDDITELESVWSGVQQEVIDAGGQAEADDYDATLAAQKAFVQAGDADGLLAESNNGLEIVDAIEGVFVK